MFIDRAECNSFRIRTKIKWKDYAFVKVVEKLPKDFFIYYWFDLGEELISDYIAIQIFFTSKVWFKEMMSIVKPKINLGVFKIAIHGIKKKERKPFVEMRKRLEENRAKV